eukprot:SAG11_NODE_2423_length_3379_cov_7.970732_4_plen_96_part_00
MDTMNTAACTAACLMFICRHSYFASFCRRLVRCIGFVAVGVITFFIRVLIVIDRPVLNLASKNGCGVGCISCVGNDARRGKRRFSRRQIFMRFDR